MYTLKQFILDTKVIIAAENDEKKLLEKIKPLAILVTKDREWLNEKMYTADPELGYGTTLLHAEDDHTLFIVVDCWLPGRGVPPHNHGTWAVVVGASGTEVNTLWQRVDSQEEGLGAIKHVELEQLGEYVIAEGEAIAMTSDVIHSVINPTEKITLSFHIYGHHLNHTGRSQFDLEHNLEKPFLIDPIER